MKVRTQGGSHLPETKRHFDICACTSVPQFFTKRFYLQTDAGTTGLGAVLIQNFSEGEGMIREPNVESGRAKLQRDGDGVPDYRLEHTQDAGLPERVPVYRHN